MYVHYVYTRYISGTWYVSRPIYLHFVVTVFVAVLLLRDECLSARGDDPSPDARRRAAGVQNKLKAYCTNNPKRQWGLYRWDGGGVNNRSLERSKFSAIVGVIPSAFNQHYYVCSRANHKRHGPPSRLDETKGKTFKGGVVVPRSLYLLAVFVFTTSEFQGSGDSPDWILFGDIHWWIGFRHPQVPRVTMVEFEWGKSPRTTQMHAVDRSTRMTSTDSCCHQLRPEKCATWWD